MAATGATPSSETCESVKRAGTSPPCRVRPVSSDPVAYSDSYDPPTRTAPVASPGGGIAILVTVLIGAAVAVGLGVFGKIHEPQLFSVSVAGVSSGTAVKSWLATLAVTLAIFQLASAFAMYRLIPGGRMP